MRTYATYDAKIIKNIITIIANTIYIGLRANGPGANVERVPVAKD